MEQSMWQPVGKNASLNGPKLPPNVSGLPYERSPTYTPIPNNLSTHGMGMNEQNTGHATGGLEPQPTNNPIAGLPYEPNPTYTPPVDKTMPTPNVSGLPYEPNPTYTPPVQKHPLQGGGTQPGGFRRPARSNFWQQITQLAKPSVTTAPVAAQRQQQQSNAARSRAAFLAGFNGVRRPVMPQPDREYVNNGGLPPGLSGTF